MLSNVTRDVHYAYEKPTGSDSIGSSTLPNLADGDHGVKSGRGRTAPGRVTERLMDCWRSAACLRWWGVGGGAFKAFGEPHFNDGLAGYA